MNDEPAAANEQRGQGMGGTARTARQAAKAPMRIDPASSVEAGSQADIVARYDRQVPRYTSYPTAPHFTASIGPDDYANWLGELTRDEPLSLYLHIPFCAELCLYCGCHTTVVRHEAPIAAYVELIKREIASIARILGEDRPVTHVHWGGGTPTILAARHLFDIMQGLRSRFDIAAGAEIAVEIDPRTLDREKARALSEIGVNRASLGVQDFDATVQRAINRIQSFEQTAQATDWLRAVGVASINFDLMYGLPHQTGRSVARSAERALLLKPDRIALFGYAHVPWMKRHQALLPEAYLPRSAERLEQFNAASATIVDRGYVAVGLDHFAVPDDELVRRQGEGRLRRNFQGYTTDRAAALIGLGTSSIGRLPQGYVQNAPSTVAYRGAIAAGRLATVRGLRLTAEDRLRGAIIERLMCDLGVDLESAAFAHDCEPDRFAPELARIDAMARDGIVHRDGYRLSVAERPFVRSVCAVFDTYLREASAAYSRAI